MKGRKRKPLALLKKYNSTRRPLNMQQPEYDLTDKLPDAHLSNQGEAYYQAVGQQLINQGILTKVDEPTLLLLANTYSALQDLLAAYNAAKQTRDRMQLLRAYNATVQTYLKLAAELGCTPTARNRITVSGTEEVSDIENEVFNS